MQILDGFILRKIGDSFIVVAVGERAKSFNGVMTLNNTGAFIISKVFDGVSDDEIVKQYAREFGVNEEVALHDFECFEKKVKEAGLIK